MISKIPNVTFMEFLPAVDKETVVEIGIAMNMVLVYNNLLTIDEVIYE